MNLNIQIDSFEFVYKTIQSNDKIRIIATTFPEEQSKAIIVNAKKIKEIHPFLTVGITESTKKLIIVFRKKNNFNKDIIFASTIIRSDQFPSKINDKHNSEIKNIPIYEPFPINCKNNNNNNSSLKNRKVLGKIEAQFAISELPQGRSNTF